MRSVVSNSRTAHKSQQRPRACSICGQQPDADTIGFSANNIHFCRNCIERLCDSESQRTEATLEADCPDSSFAWLANENRAKLSRMGWTPPPTLNCSVCSQITFYPKTIERNEVCVCFECVRSFGDALETELFRRGEISIPIDNDAPDVSPNSGGWIRCPTCGEHFSVYNPRSWTGMRHRRCRQLLRIRT